jgi:ABC-type branched-subunit amino acid transport system substrate-binding protein
MALALALAFGAANASAENAPGVSDTEIKIGQTMPYSGSLSLYSTVGKAELAYLRMINDKGGINGRKIKLISLDDSYSPPKTVEQTRKLVEQEGVAFLFASLGTPTNAAIQKYLNDRKIPQLLTGTASSRFNDPNHYPWTVPSLGTASYSTEGRIYGRYIAEKFPRGKIAILYQNDDSGKDFVRGLRDGLGDKSAQLIVASESYEATDPTVDSQIVTLQGSGADIFYNASSARTAAQAIRKAYDIGWRPTQFLTSPSAFVGLVFEPAGLEKAIGIISATAGKDVTDPNLRDDPAYQDWLAWMRKYYPEGNVIDQANVGGYNLAQLLVYILTQCGDDLSRENILRKATNIRDLHLPMLLPGIAINTTPTDYEGIKRLYMRRFNGTTWELLESVANGVGTNLRSCCRLMAISFASLTAHDDAAPLSGGVVA